MIEMIFSNLHGRMFSVDVDLGLTLLYLGMQLSLGGVKPKSEAN